MLNRFSMAVCAAALAHLAACQPRPAATETSTEPVIALEAAAPANCSTGRTLAETLICDDGDPSLFAQISDAPLITPKCVWYTEQLMLNENEFLVFRNQDCSAEGFDGAAYAVVGDTVRINTAMAPETAIEGEIILEMLFKADQQTGADVALARLADAPEAEKDRCIVRPVEEPMFPGAIFELSPDDKFMAELVATQEPFSACGPYGVTDGVQFFEDRGARVLFHRLGQDQSYWDPASFTFYVRGTDGKFVKAVEN